MGRRRLRPSHPVRYRAQDVTVTDPGRARNSGPVGSKSASGPTCEGAVGVPRGAASDDGREQRLGAAAGLAAGTRLVARPSARTGGTADARGEPLIRIRGLRFARGDRVVFDGVDMDIPRGQVTAVMGPSGTGKTTLLKLISGQLRPDAGTIEVDGHDVHALSHGELYRLRTRMGMLFQSGALLTDLSVFENVAYPLREHTRLPESMIRKLVLMKLEAVGLRGARDLVPSELSGGMARRVALARAVALDPMMIMYDEPFTGQDPISMGVLVTLIRQLNDASRLTSIVVSHDVRETASIADRIYLIADGKIMAKGTPQEVDASDSGWVKQFMHGEADGPVHFHYPAPELSRDFLG